MGKRIDIRRHGPEQSARDFLTSILRTGAQKMLQQAIEEEINAYIASVNGSTGETTIIRNGYLPQRRIQSAIGDVKVQQPRCRNKTKDQSVTEFSSRILPPIFVGREVLRTSSCGFTSKVFLRATSRRLLQRLGAGRNNSSQALYEVKLTED